MHKNEKILSGFKKITVAFVALFFTLKMDH